MIVKIRIFFIFASGPPENANQRVKNNNNNNNNNNNKVIRKKHGETWGKYPHKPRTNLILFLTLLSLLRNFGVRLSHVISGGISFLVFLSCFRD